MGPRWVGWHLQIFKSADVELEYNAGLPVFMVAAFNVPCSQSLFEVKFLNICVNYTKHLFLDVLVKTLASFLNF